MYKKGYGTSNEAAASQSKRPWISKCHLSNIYVNKIKLPFVALFCSRFTGKRLCELLKKQLLIGILRILTNNLGIGHRVSRGNYAQEVIMTTSILSLKGG